MFNLNVKNEEETILKALGIEEERAEELMLLIKRAFRKGMKKSESYKYFSERTACPEEYTFCVQTYCEISFQNNNPIASIIASIISGEFKGGKIGPFPDGKGGMIFGIINPNPEDEHSSSHDEEKDSIDDLINQSFKINGKPGERKPGSKN